MLQKVASFPFTTEISELASEGLRTLVFCCREFEAGEFDPWIDLYRAAQAALENRLARICDCGDRLEQQFETLGITGLEDRLQKEVPQTINWVRSAGIKIWVLTGDKLETATSIGRTAGVISKESDVLIMGHRDSAAVETQLNTYSKDIKSFTMPVFVVTGDALEILLEHHQEQFLDLAERMFGVIMCRVSPFVKGQVAHILHERGRVLAIGDGANDVSMIQRAHVGVGICGREGPQASLASDFSLPAFRFLRRLLMIHGHWTYRRFAYAAVIILYKNFVFIFPQFWFGFETMWSPTIFYDSFLMSMYNTLFTPLCPVIFGFWEQDLPQKILMRHPEVYHVERDPMRLVGSAVILFNGMWQSLCVYYGIRLLNPRGPLAENGTMSFWILVYVVHLQVMLWGNSFNAFTIGINAGIFVVVAAGIIAYIAIANWELFPVLSHALTSSTIMIGWLMAIAIGLFPSVLVSALLNRFWPSRVRRLVEEYNAQRKVKVMPEPPPADP